jgi:hypothetical protein
MKKASSKPRGWNTFFRLSGRAGQYFRWEIKAVPCLMRTTGYEITFAFGDQGAFLKNRP